MPFPAVRGSNLERRRYALPGELDGQLNLVLIAFQRWHQNLVDTWIPFAQALEERQPQLRYFELPVLNRMNPLYRTFLDGGMRAGIPDRHARERTITLYLDKESFRRSLGIPNEDTIHVLLIDRQGTVHWRGEGAFEPSLGAELEAVLGQ